MSVDLKIETAVLCDDVRLEINGKLILIGVYTGDVVIPKFPNSVSVMLFLMGQVISGGQIAPRVKVTDDSGTVLFRQDEISSPQRAEFKEGPFAMNLACFFSLHKESLLKFFVELDGNDVEVLRRKFVQQPQQPSMLATAHETTTEHK